jgi:surface carbohydrate biosynthesis protein (TIGR04326 family)
MSKTLIIVDSLKHYSKKESDILLWSSIYNSSDNNIFCLPKIVEDKSQYCKEKYVSFIHNLGELVVGGKKIIDYFKIDEKFSFWWTSLLVEKSNIGKSVQINEIIKILAFEKWLEEQNYNKVIVKLGNSKIIKVLSLFFNERNIIFEIDKVLYKEKRKKKFYKNLPYFIQSLVWLFWKIINIWPLIGVGVDKWSKSNSKITFLSSLINLKKDSVKTGIFKSNYWPILPDLMKKNNCPTNWIHMYSETSDLPNAKSTKKIINNFNKSNNGIESHSTVYSFLNIFIVFKVVFYLIKFTYFKFKLYKHIEVESSFFWPFIDKDFEDSFSGINATRNLLYLFLFQAALDRLSIQNKGFYLHENQGWEYAFINSWRKSKHKDNLFAIQHTPIKFWDLRKFIDKRTIINAENLMLPLPDYIGVNSDISKVIYLNSGFSKSKIIELEALRYLDLNIFDGCLIEGLNQSKLTVLLLGDYSKENTFKQLELLNDSVKFLKKPIQFLVKPHPTTPIFLDNYPDLDMVITNRSISEIIKCSDIVYTGSTTSSAVDAYYLGAKVVTTLNNDQLNTSPLREFHDVEFVSSSEELAKILNNLNHKDKNFKIRNEVLYINKKIPKWREILEIN